MNYLVMASRHVGEYIGKLATTLSQTKALRCQDDKFMHHFIKAACCGPFIIPHWPKAVLTLLAKL
jgi:hypothetical protein